MAWIDEKSGCDRINGERRGDRRYEIALDLRWKLVRRRKVLDSGVGRTFDLSSGGIRFDAGRQLPLGLGIELAIAWPALLHNVAPMQLVVSGRIIRTNGTEAAILMDQHEFRTAGLAVDHRSPFPRNPVTLANGSLLGKFGTLQ